MHLEIANEEGSQVAEFGNDFITFLYLEQVVQKLFSIKEPVLFHYVDEERENVIIVNDSDLFVMQESFEKDDKPRVLFAIRQRLFLMSQSSPALVKLVLKRYLANFHQTEGEDAFQAFSQALFFAESVLAERNFSPLERERFRDMAFASFDSGELESGDSDESGFCDNSQSENDEVNDEIRSVKEVKTADFDFNFNFDQANNEVLVFDDHVTDKDFLEDSSIISSLEGSFKNEDRFTKDSSIDERMRVASTQKPSFSYSQERDLKDESLFPCQNESKCLNISDLSVSYEVMFQKTRRNKPNMSMQDCC